MIAVVDGPAEGVAKKLLREAFHELFLLGQERGLELLHALEFAPAWQLAAHVQEGRILVASHAFAVLPIAPNASGIVIFQGETKRVHTAMATRTIGGEAMLIKAFADAAR